MSNLDIAAARAAMQKLAAAGRIPPLPRPNDSFDGGIVIASCWGNDDPDEGIVFAEVMLLQPDIPYYRLMQIEVDEYMGNWAVNVGTETRHRNVMPATEDYSDRVGGY